MFAWVPRYLLLPWKPRSPETKNGSLFNREKCCDFRKTYSSRISSFHEYVYPVTVGLLTIPSSDHGNLRSPNATPPQEIRPFFRDFEAPLSHEGLLGARVLTSFHLSLDSKPLENHMQKPRNWNFLEDFPNDVPCEVLKKVPIFFFSGIYIYIWGWNPSHLCGNSHKPWNKDPCEATRIQWKVISFFDFSWLMYLCWKVWISIWFGNFTKLGVVGEWVLGCPMNLVNG